MRGGREKDGDEEEYEEVEVEVDDDEDEEGAVVPANEGTQSALPTTRGMQNSKASALVLALVGTSLLGILCVRAVRNSDVSQCFTAARSDARASHSDSIGS